jgi:hypothetical protein
VVNKLLTYVAVFKYFEMTLLDHNYINEEISSWLNLGRAYCRSLQNDFTSCLICEVWKNKIYRPCNFASWFVWVWNLISYSKERAQTEGVWEQGAGENIWM